MKITRYLALALAAGLLVCTATACSSSDDSLSKADWVKQANAICVAGSKQTEALSKKLTASGSPSTAEMNTYIKAATANSVAQIAKIKTLGYPAGDKAELEGALVTWEDTLNQMAKNPAKAQELSADKKVTAATTTLRKYGLSKCAGSGA